MTEADELRAVLRADLVAALKARQPDAVAALRTAIAAIDNGEAVEAPGALPPASSEHIAGARTGPGAGEAARRRLDGAELRAILREQVAELGREAGRYEALGQAEAARRLRRQADVLGGYLDPAP